jgi:hypothetical protein
MFKKILIAFVILASLSMYEPVFIPENIIKFLELGVPVFMLLLVILFYVYDKSFHFQHLFRFEMILILIAVMISMCAAFFFHHQKFTITAVTQRFIYFFFGYSFLHALKPKPEELTRMIVYFGIVYIVFYLLQMLLYPFMLFNIGVLVERGTTRIFVPGSGYLFLAYIICLGLFIKTFHYKYFFMCLASMIIFVLLGTRQVIAPAVIIAILMVLLSKKVKSRFVIIILSICIVIPLYFLFKDIFVSMFEVSQKQISNFNQDVRYRAVFFYLFEFFPNKLSYLTGNGVPSSLSPYGIKVNAFQKALGYFQSDIGIIGDYAKFGILIAIAEISLCIRVLTFKLSEGYQFIKYYFFALLITIFLSDGPFSTAENIFIICLLLYMIDVSRHNKSDTMPEPEIHDSIQPLN